MHLASHVNFNETIFAALCVYFFTGMENLQCIIHYYIKNTNYSKIKPISAKSIRKSKGGNHHRKEQCDATPSEIDPTKHGIHLTPCYKKFVLIISQEK